MGEGPRQSASEGGGRRTARRRLAERQEVLELSAVGLAFPIAILVGFFLGREVGGWLGAPGSGAVVGGIVGALGGFSNFFRISRRFADEHDEDQSG